jgi:GMP synthase (glutamine-hydrolysing)
VLGVCLGAQLVADAMGAGVSRAPAREIGWFPVEFGPGADDLGLPGRLDAFHWHGDTFDVPVGAAPFASSPACANQAFSADNRRIVALQFHLESTPEGVEALLSECPGDYAEPGEWVQAPEQIAGTPDRFDSAHGALFDMMDALAP